MNGRCPKDGRLPSGLQADLDSIAMLIRSTAQSYRNQSHELLALLRVLESIHQEVRDGLFQDSLPDNRQALYALLRDIENDGGWPYIHRMKLQAFLAQIPQEPEDDRTHPIND
ncbi:hypothetical protein C7B61_03500 [filamentous cyanobacterium CCP1]|nr:hypothetical protein C7B76_03205 [filamentous cyanobacterium CCP2]PSB67939.1 hypothetical protein C7B61_03500 [filamentous cyanobacterium CCP1]